MVAVPLLIGQPVITSVVYCPEKIDDFIFCFDAFPCKEALDFRSLKQSRGVLPQLLKLIGAKRRNVSTHLFVEVDLGVLINKQSDLFDSFSWASLLLDGSL